MGKNLRSNWLSRLRCIASVRVLVVLSLVVFASSVVVYYLFWGGSWGGGSDSPDQEASPEYSMQPPEEYTGNDLNFAQVLYSLRSCALGMMNDYEGGDPQVESIISGLESRYDSDMIVVEQSMESWGEGAPEFSQGHIVEYSDVGPERWEGFSDLSGEEQTEEFYDLIKDHQRSVLEATNSLEEDAVQEIQDVAYSARIHASTFLQDLDDMG